MTDPAPPTILANAVSALNAHTQDPRLRDYIAVALAQAINESVAPYMRATGVLPPPVAKLSTSGLTFLTPLPARDIEQARAWFENAPAEAGGRFSAATVLAAPHLIEMATDRALLATVREFLGAPGTLLRAEAWANGAAPSPSESFRRDKSGVKSCRLRINLADVAPDTADQYVRGSANLERLLQALGPDAATVERMLVDTVPAETLAAGLKDGVIPLAGRSGAVFLYNPFGLLRRGGAGPVVEFTYGLIPAPDTFLPCGDVAALTARLAGDPFSHYTFRLAARIDAAGVSQTVAEVSAPPVQLAPKHNPLLTGSNRGLTVSTVRDPFFTRDSKIFAMGSCFALEIRKVLTERGFDVYPKYDKIPFDPLTQGLAKLPERDNVNHYNTFSIRQEFELAFGGERYKADNFWQVDRGFTRVKASPLIQAPHRKQIFAASREAAADLNRKIDDCIASGIHTADVIIITLGLIETWVSKADGLIVATPPGDARAASTESAYATFHHSTFEENYANIKRVADLVFAHYPDKQLVFTVSPVVLGTTFTQNDIVVANCESKSVLRAAVGKLMRDYPADRRPRVRYWPSYEIALAHDILEDGGSTVRAEGVRMIMDAFLATHLA